jgi:hypothetical protein
MKDDGIWYLSVQGNKFWALSLWGAGTITLDPTFESFTTLDEPISLMKVFRLFRLEQKKLVLSVDIVDRCTTSSYLLAGPASL